VPPAGQGLKNQPNSVKTSTGAFIAGRILVNTIELVSADGHRLAAHVARPVAPARAGVVVVQEIFGVNSHIRSVADGYAAEGFLAIAPALFDRVRPGIELGYAEADMNEGFAHKVAVGNDAPLLDIAAAIAWLRAQGMTRVGIVGYCWGGLLSWLAATRLAGLDASAPYYGGGMPDFKDEKAQCPVMAHFAEQDRWIPLPAIEAFGVAQQGASPPVEIHRYAAHHGFNCDQRGAWEPVAARLARERTLAFFARHLG
jgi:carboxymethylenebutenolidase